MVKKVNKCVAVDFANFAITKPDARGRATLTTGGSDTDLGAYSLSAIIEEFKDKKDFPMLGIAGPKICFGGGEVLPDLTAANLIAPSEYWFLDRNGLRWLKRMTDDETVDSLARLFFNANEGMVLSHIDNFVAELTAARALAEEEREKRLRDNGMWAERGFEFATETESSSWIQVRLTYPPAATIGDVEDFIKHVDGVIGSPRTGVRTRAGVTGVSLVRYSRSR